MSKKKKKNNSKLNFQVDPEYINLQVTFISEEVDVCNIKYVEFFYKFDASNLAILVVRQNGTGTLKVATVEQVVETEPYEALLDGLTAGDYLLDLSTGELIWNFSGNYLEDYSGISYTLGKEVEKKISLFGNHSGELYLADGDGYFEEIAYAHYKASFLTPSKPTTLGVSIFSGALLQESSRIFPHYMTPMLIKYFDEQRQTERNVPILHKSQLDTAIVLLEEAAKEKVKKQLDDDDSLYDGVLSLSSIIEHHPTKWSPIAGLRYKVSDDVGLPFEFVKSCSCRNNVLTFYVKDLATTPRMIAKHLGLPDMTLSNIMTTCILTE